MRRQCGSLRGGEPPCPPHVLLHLMLKRGLFVEVCPLLRLRLPCGSLLPGLCLLLPALSLHLLPCYPCVPQPLPLCLCLLPCPPQTVAESQGRREAPLCGSFLAGLPGVGQPGPEATLAIELLHALPQLSHALLLLPHSLLHPLLLRLMLKRGLLVEMRPLLGLRLPHGSLPGPFLLLPALSLHLPPRYSCMPQPLPLVLCLLPCPQRLLLSNPPFGIEPGVLLLEELSALGKELEALLDSLQLLLPEISPLLRPLLRPLLCHLCPLLGRLCPLLCLPCPLLCRLHLLPSHG